jgi:type II secretory ATPase GspE/PulE/Tfp pilus assembly ATPase PilB-like protein
VGLDRFRGGDGPLVIYEPGGCQKCRNTGYAGRIAVVELLTPDETTHRLILSRASNEQIQAAACRNGMQTMFESGLRHVVAGTTSLGEVLRSIRFEG